MTATQNPHAPYVNSRACCLQRCTNDDDFIQPSVSRLGPCEFGTHAGVKARGIFLGKAL